MNINDELTRKIAAIAQGIMAEDNTNKKSDDGEGLDKVQPKAVKKKFDDRKDKDIDNDGDVDSSDEYIHAKRKAISKAIKSESTDLKEATELYKKGKITLTKFAMGKGKGAGLQVNYGMKFIQIPKEDVKQLYTGMAYITKSVPQFKESVEVEEATDLEEATMSQGVKTAATQIYSLEKSLKVGSNLNKGVNKSLEGKYDADFKKMQKAIGDIINVWEEIERDFAMNESTDFEKTNTLTSDEYDEVQNFKNFNKKDWKWNAIKKKFIRK